MMRDFEQVEWDAVAAERCRRLAELALEEDLAGGTDHTAAIAVPPDARGAAGVVARRAGVVAGLPTISVVIDVFGSDVSVCAAVADGQSIEPRAEIARLEGRVRDLLAVERTLLNFLGRLSGIASLTRQYVDAVAGSGAKIYDTRKTTPGWRRLEKYAVRVGGASNHRFGLDDGLLIKDNHVRLAGGVAPAVERARRGAPPGMRVEVEVTTLEEVDQALEAGAETVLLDNMPPAQMREAVRRTAGRARLDPGRPAQGRRRAAQPGRTSGREHAAAVRTRCGGIERAAQE